MRVLNILALGTAGFLLAGTAYAETAVTVATDLNLRSGPGPNYQILAVMPASSSASVIGCLAETSWCKVAFEGQTGWAAGDYLAAKLGEETVLVYQNRADVQIETVTVSNDEQEAMNATALGTLGLAIGAIVGGPLAIAVGGIAGVATGEAVTPDEKVVTFVTSNPVEPVFLNGEIVVGAGIPDGVEFFQVPESEFAYMNLNGQYVLVQPTDRKIVYIYR